MDVKRDVVIFDLYGTLADVEVDETSDFAWRAIVDSLSSVSRTHSVPTPTEFAASFRAECEVLAAQGVDTSITDLAFARLSQIYGADSIPGIVQFWSRCLRRDSLKTLSLRDYTLGVISDLRAAPGNTICLLSNTEAALTRFDLEYLGIANLFDLIVLSSDVGSWKPQHEIGSEILQSVGSDPAAAVIVGDTPATDGELARSLGCPFVFVANEVGDHAEATALNALVARPTRESIDRQLMAAGVSVAVRQ
jgi:HAD superfamily hydrolase (TIGR01549 family)